jgi:hypothetical protein
MTYNLLFSIIGALAEIAFAIDCLGAYGISVTSSYGDGSDAGSSKAIFFAPLNQELFHTVYIGDDRYAPIWEELNRRQAVVFLHGAQTASSTPFPHEFLGIPVSEVTSEQRFRISGLTSLI